MSNVSNDWIVYFGKFMCVLAMAVLFAYGAYFLTKKTSIEWLNKKFEKPRTGINWIEFLIGRVLIRNILVPILRLLGHIAKVLAPLWVPVVVLFGAMIMPLTFVDTVINPVSPWALLRAAVSIFMITTVIKCLVVLILIYVPQYSNVFKWIGKGIDAIWQLPKTGDPDYAAKKILQENNRFRVKKRLIFIALTITFAEVFISLLVLTRNLGFVDIYLVLVVIPLGVILGRVEKYLA